MDDPSKQKGRSSGTEAENGAMLDSAATHLTISADDEEYFEEAGSRPVAVELASGSAEAVITADRELRLPGGTTPLVPLGRAIRLLHLDLHWSAEGLMIRNEDGSEIKVTLVNDLPYICKSEFARLRRRLRDVQMNQSDDAFAQLRKVMGRDRARLFLTALAKTLAAKTPARMMTGATSAYNVDTTTSTTGDNDATTTTSTTNHHIDATTSTTTTTEDVTTTATTTDDVEEKT